METTVIHLVCTFVTFCTGGSCSDYTPMEVNLRFQPDREFGEFWISPENALFPHPTLVTLPGAMSIDRRTHIYAPAVLGTPYLISLSPDYTDATLTTHLPRPPDIGGLSAASADGPCRAAEDGA